MQFSIPNTLKQENSLQNALKQPTKPSTQEDNDNIEVKER